MGFYLFLRLGLLSARAFPFRRFSDLCARFGRMAAWLSPARAHVAANLSAIHAAGGKLTAPGDVFESYGRYWGETLALAARPQRLKRLRFDVRGLEYLLEAQSRGPVCVLAGHTGNWDVLAHWLSREVPGIAIMVERLKPNRLYELFGRIRGALGCRTLAAEGGGRELYRHFMAGGHAALAADRVIGAGWREATILGGRRRLPSAGMDLARRAGATLLPVFILREGINFVIQVHPPLAENEDPVAGYAHALECELAEAPEQWCVLYPLHDGAVGAQPALAARKAVAS